MKRASIVIVTFVAAATLLAAATVTGAWTMKVEGSPHGDMTAGLTLKQDGTKVTGTFSTGHSPDLTVSGAFIDGELKLETPQEEEHKIVFTAKLKDDGTLAGFLSSPMGDMKWTATRAPAEKKD